MLCFVFTHNLSDPRYTEVGLCFGLELKMTKFVALLDRAVLEVTGPDAGEFLQGLITNDLEKLKQKGSLFAALLTPQGKINYEFFIVPTVTGFFLEMAKGGLDELFKKLSLYKLRANVDISNLSETHMVFWLAEPCDLACPEAQLYPDPRSVKLGQRAIVSVDHMTAFCEGLDACTPDDYLSARLAAGIPEGGHDYALGNTFPHEACYDLIDGIDFTKGCYVGQEVVSRMQHRSTVRKRIVCVTSEEELPESGTEIRTETSLIGVLGSRLGKEGLALVRLDRAGKALNSGDKILTENILVTLSLPSWASYDFVE